MLDYGAYTPIFPNLMYVAVAQRKMSPEKTPSRRKKRPTPKFKPPMAQAIARTKALKRAGLIPQDCIPSAMPAGRALYDEKWKAKHGAAHNAKRRAQRAILRTIRTADVGTKEWFAAAFRHPSLPKGKSLQAEFVFRLGLYCRNLGEFVAE